MSNLCVKYLTSRDISDQVRSKYYIISYFEIHMRKPKF